MKFHFFYIYIWVFFLFLQLRNFVKADENHSLVSEIKIFRNDTVFKENYLYDKNNLPVLISKYSLQKDESLIPVSQTEMFYENNTLIKKIERVWKNQKWDDLFFTDYIFENKSLKSRNYFQIINSVRVPLNTIAVVNQNSKPQQISIGNYSSGFSNSVQKVSNTFQNNQIVESNIEYVHPDNSNSKIRFINSYNENLLKESVYQLYNLDNNWINKSKTTFYYNLINDSARLVRQKNSMWDSQNKKWVNYTNIQIDYDPSGNLISETFAHWKTMSWVETVKYEYKYDAAHVLLSKSMLMPVFQRWRSFSTVSYNKSSAIQLNIESKYDFWGGKSGTFKQDHIPFVINGENQVEIADKMEISLMTNKIENVKDNSNELNIYPNPSEGLFYFGAKFKPFDVWEVFDLQGKLVQSSINSSFSGVIDLTAMPSGIYVFEANSDNSIIRKKLIIQK